MKNKQIRHLIIALMALVLALCQGAFAESYDAGTMRLLHYEGAVEILDASGEPRFIMENVRFDSGETLVTGEDGIAAVSLDTDRIVTLDANSRAIFEQQGNSMKLTLKEGALLLDVQKKLDENESLDIQTSTMTVGIRGTIVFLTERPSKDGQGIQNTLGVLEGTAEISYVNRNGIRQAVQVEQGKVAIIEGNSNSASVSEVQVKPMGIETVPGFATNLPEELSSTNQRVEESMELLNGGEEKSTFPADGQWTWEGTVTLVAQSASKLYDGQPLMRPSDSLVYGLPADFSIRVTAAGSQTDAGEGKNVIASYAIYNDIGEDVTRHFPNIEKVDGQLVVDPAPLTIWTGSAEKVYDGTPLTNPEAGLTAYPGYEKNIVAWRNLSYVQTTSTDAEVLLGLCGVTWVHGTNPLTGDTREIALQTGEKLTVILNEDEEKESIEFVIEKVPEDEIPEEALRLYVQNPELLAQACLDAGWDPEIIAERIAQLTEEEGAMVTQRGLTMSAEEADRLMVDCTNVRITVDTEITTYNDRALGSEEAHYTPVSIPESIHVTATGSQTEVGESENTYEIDWGTSSPGNYILSEELGTLTVTAAPEEEPEPYDDAVRLTAPSAEKVYDGKPLIEDSFTASGLPEGFTITAAVSGSQTDVGSSENSILDYKILDADGQDVTALFTNVSTTSGTLTVTPATATVRTSSATKPYDGEALRSEETEIIGLAEGDAVTVTATGSIRDVGAALNTYAIDWGETNKNNYVIAEELGTLQVTSHDEEVTFTASSVSKTYDGTPLTIALVVESNGDAPVNPKLRKPEAQTNVLKAYRAGPEADVIITVTGLPRTLSFTAKASASQTNVGSYKYTITDLAILDADGVDVTKFFTNVKTIEGTLTVEPAEVTIATGSASKSYDGTPLTNSEASIVGLIDGEEATVTATGTITEVGSVENTYEIDWGETNKDNYIIVENLGKLTVTSNEVEVTITAASSSKVYDGTPLSSDSFTVNGLPEGFTVEATVTGRQTDVGTGENAISDYTILDADGEDVTDKFVDVNIVNGTLTVEPAEVTIATGSASKAYDGTPLTSTEVTITGLVEGETATVTATGTITEIGSAENTYEIDWGETNKDNYNIKEELGTLTVTASESEITITAASGSKVYDGKPLANDGFTVSGLPEGFTVTATVSGSQKDAGSSENTVGAYTILDSDGTDVAASFPNIKTEVGTLTVEVAEVTVTTGSASKPYDGTPLTSSEATVSGLAEGETVTVTATGTITEVGSSENTCTIDWGETNKDNYTITEELGTLTITESEAEITITAASDTKTYDGKPLINDSFTVSGVPEGFTVTATVSGSQMDAGNSENTVAAYTILDGDGADVTASFLSIKTEVGTLTVEAAEVTITTGSASKAYDGTALTSNEATITGLAESETVSVTATGTITEVGSTENTYTIDWGETKEDNYKINEELGTLTITESEAEITITAASETKTYDGKPLTNEDFTVTGLPEGFTVTATVSGSQTDVGSSENTVAAYTILNGDGADVTASFPSIKTEVGTLIVEPAEVTITTGSASKVYDGTPLTSGEATITGLAAGENATVTATGSITEVGTSENTYTIDWGEANPANYTITETLGTLEVTENDAGIIITANSASKVYDGAPLTSDAVTVTGLPEDFICTATVSGTQTDVGESTNTITAYTILDAGGNDVTASFTDVALMDGKLTVTPAAITITAGSASKVYDGTPLTADSYTVENLPPSEDRRTFEAEVTVSGSQTDAGTLDNEISEYHIYLEEEGGTSGMTWARNTEVTENFNVILVPGTLTVAPAPLTITTGSASKAYDGTALTSSEANITGLVGGETATVTATGTITEVGSTENTYTIDWGTTKETNYSVTEEIGTLTVTDNNVEVTFTAASGIKVYDGKELTNDGYMVSGLPEGFTTTATASGTQKDVGTSENTISAYSILNGDGVDVTASFTNIKTEVGTLVVDPAGVTITTGSASKAYDGTPLTSSEATITGLAEGETATVTTTGTITKVGTAENTYTIDWGTTKGTNYSVTEELGTLTVTENNVEITVTADSDNKVYDGKPLTKDSFTAAGLPTGFTVTATLSGSQTDVGSSENTVLAYSILDAENADVTAFFTNVKTEVGTLTVNPAEVTITTGSASKAYDSAPLTSGEATITGLVGGETATVTATGTITDVGSTDNTYDIDWGGTNKNNYTVTESIGTLKVTPMLVSFSLGGYTTEYNGDVILPDGLSSKNAFIGEIEILTDDEECDIGIKASFSLPGGVGTLTVYSFENVGSYTLTPEVAFLSGKAENYEFSYTDDALVIEPMEVTVSLHDGSVLTYNGEEQLGKFSARNSKFDIGYQLSDRRGFVWGSDRIVVNVTGGGTDAGDYTLSCTCVPDEGSDISNYKINVTNTSMTIAPAALTIQTPSASRVYDGSALTAGPATVTGLVGADAAKVTVTCTGTITEVGTTENAYSIDWGGVNSGNYTITEELGTLEILDSDIPITLTSASAEKVYDGTPLTGSSEVTVAGVPEGYSCTATAAGSQTNAGSSANAITYTITDPDGADVTGTFTNVTKKEGTLTVKKLPVIIDLGYSGETVPYAAVSFKENVSVTEIGGMKYTLEGPFDADYAIYYSWDESWDESWDTASGYIGFRINGSAYNVGDYTVTPDHLNYDTENLDLQFVNNTITIEPVPLKVTTGSASKYYDGTPLTEPGITVEGLVGWDKTNIPYKATGTITEVGTTTNTYEIDWDGAFAYSGNYTITEELGTLEILDSDIPITLTSASAEKVYDGTPLTGSSEVTVAGLPEGYSCTATAAGSQTDAGSSANAITYAITDPDGADVTGTFTNVTKKEGTLTVKKLPVTITTESATKPYDGTPLTAPATITGLVAADEGKVTVSATGKITNAGTAENTYSISWGSVNSGNYEITKELGTLRVQKRHFNVTTYANTGSPNNQEVPYKYAWYNITYRWGQSDDDGNPIDGGYSYSSSSRVDEATGTYTWPWGDEFVITATGGGWKVGEYPSNGSVSFNSGDPSNYVFEFTNKTLTITPAPITVTTYGNEKTYDGLPIGPENTAAPILGLVGTDADYVSAHATGAATELVDVGEADNGYEIYWNGVNSANYKIVENLGKLKINPAPVTVTVESASKTYDGKPLQPGDLNVGGLPDGFLCSIGGDTVKGTQTDVGESDITLDLNGLSFVDAELNPVEKSNFIISTDIGKLTVTRAKLEVYTGTSYKAEYDGTPLTNDYAALEGLVNDETATVTATGSQTEIGESPNTYTITWGTAKQGNYEIEEHLGYLYVGTEMLADSVSPKRSVKLTEASAEPAEAFSAASADGPEAAPEEKPEADPETEPEEDPEEDSPEEAAQETAEEIADDPFKDNAVEDAEKAAEESGGKGEDEPVAEPTKETNEKASGGSEAEPDPED